jgi:hypoxanthine-guanine phosphoribosyltransferase
MTIDYEYYKAHKQEIFDICCMLIEEFEEKHQKMIEKEIKKSFDCFVTQKQFMAGYPMDKMVDIRDLKLK